VPRLIPLSPAEFKHKRLQANASFAFAAEDALIPLVIEELPKAIMCLPTGFIEFEAGFIPVAIQGFVQGQNLLVSKDGQWLGNYVPAPYRAYPFQLAALEDGQEVLCVNDDSGLITEDLDGRQFFEEDGRPSELTQSVLNFLTEIRNNKEATLIICNLLKKHNLIVPWNIKVKTPAGERNVSGVFRIDESILNSLSTEAFEELRVAGALPVIYCQLLSIQHLDLLGKIASKQDEQHGIQDLETLDFEGFFGGGANNTLKFNS